MFFLDFLRIAMEKVIYLLLLVEELVSVEKFGMGGLLFRPLGWVLMNISVEVPAKKLIEINRAGGWRVDLEDVIHLIMMKMF